MKFNAFVNKSCRFNELNFQTNKTVISNNSLLINKYLMHSLLLKQIGKNFGERRNLRQKFVVFLLCQFFH